MIIGIVLNTIFSAINLSQGLPYVTESVTEIILAIMSLFIMKQLGLFSKDLFGKHNLSLGLKLGSFVILTGVVQLIIFLTLNVNNPMTFTLAPIIGAIVYSFAVGVYEEIFMRGLILQNLMTVFGHSKRGVYKTLILASLFFGLAHLINLTHAPLLDTLIQVVYAMTAGIILGAVFLRTNNLLSVILLHGVFDLFTYLTNTVYAGHFVSYNLVQYPGIYIGYNLFLIIGNLVIGLLIARKIKPLKEDISLDVKSSENQVIDLKV
ncbi:MAG: CPBP family intramembrane metalloprotease [Methanobacteriaceae archaeon]|uniref:CPBP family intramembrane glutamic endopeptidase n=2 Tax=unclassified Methanobrevibacter TaxID=2638681 RepID=UPI0037607A4A|nr:CPBP family intramembrane metalloprotease [Methanobacteriaceae archaeon]